MKKIILLLLSVSCFSGMNSLFAQKVPDQTLEGFAVGVQGIKGVKKNDTIKGFITIYNQLARQEKAIFYADMSNVRTKKIWEPKRVKGYGTDGKFYEAIAYPSSSDNEPQSFAELVKKGKLTMYYWYTVSAHSDKQNARKPEIPYEEKELTREILIKKANGQVDNVFTMKFSNFKKAMSEYLKEDKELAKKIESKELGRDKIEEIVDEYNEWASKKKH